MVSTLKELRIDTLINKIDEIATNNFKDYKIEIKYKDLKIIDYIYKKLGCKKTLRQIRKY